MPTLPVRADYWIGCPVLTGMSDGAPHCSDVTSFVTGFKMYQKPLDGRQMAICVLPRF